MRALTLMAAALAAAIAVPAGAQSVKAGVEAWQQGDFGRATAIWRVLADKGDADAAFNLGQAYRLGRGVNASSADAAAWFEKAAKKNHLDAQVSLGLLLFDSGDRVKALQWLGLAAEHARGAHEQHMRHQDGAHISSQTIQASTLERQDRPVSAPCNAA